MHTKSVLELHFIVFLWGFTAVLGVLISLGPTELVLIRTFFSALGLLILKLLGGKSFYPGSGMTLRLIGTGVVFAIHWILFFGSAKVANVSVLLVGMSTVTFWTAVIEPLFGKKRISILELILGGIIVSSAYLAFGFDAEANHLKGFTMAIGSAICAAVFTVLNGSFAKRLDHFVVMGWEMLGASLTCVLLLPFISGDGLQTLSFRMTMEEVFYMAVLVIVCTLYAYSASVRLMKQVTPFMVNLTISLEPLYGIGLAYLIFGDAERMSGSFYLGGLIILVAVFSYPFLRRRLYGHPS